MNEVPATVLVVDDDAQIRRFLRTGFELEGYRVLEAATGEAGLREAVLLPVDLIVLDLGLPDLDGATIVERVRSWSAMPIIILSVVSDELEKIRLLELGVDDYVVKPFGMGELLARVRAALRRSSRATAREPVLTLGPLTIDLAARRVSVDGARIALSPKEYRLLQLLAQHAGNVLTHQHLLNEVWGPRHVHDGHYLRILMRKLRQKIEKDPTRPCILLTELGVGYRLVSVTTKREESS